MPHPNQLKGQRYRRQISRSLKAIEETCRIIRGQEYLDQCQDSEEFNIGIEEIKAQIEIIGNYKTLLLRLKGEQTEPLKPITNKEHDHASNN